MASVALIAAWLPLSVSVPLPLLPALMLAPPDSVTSSVPLDTLSADVASSLAVMPPPLSGSATDRPVMATWVSSNTLGEAGMVFTGGRLTVAAGAS